MVVTPSLNFADLPVTENEGASSTVSFLEDPLPGSLPHNL